jgi:N6-L-threonylcarbamoyladenine synthase
MITLAIETSCDETSICILETRGQYPAIEYRVLSHIIHSQVDIHAKYGGVFPMMAKREHAKRLVPLTLNALQESNIGGKSFEASTDAIDNVRKICGEHDAELCEMLLKSNLAQEKLAIDRIAVTMGPGLEPALWVGVNFANALSALWNIPVTGENHMEGHIVAALVPKGETKYTFMKLNECAFPAIALLLSGGHTEIVLVKGVGDYSVIGRTRDDAVGEAFDKVARMLGLPYPGGPEISKLAEMERNLVSKGEASSRDEGDLRARLARTRGIFQQKNIRAPKALESLSLPDKITLPRPMIDSGDLDMSFAGLKTAVLYKLRDQTKITPEITPEIKAEMAREFEDAVADVIVAKLEIAFDQNPALALIGGGGVMANAHIRRACEKFAADRGIPFFPPGPGLSGDNAFMIALSSVLATPLAPNFSAQNKKPSDLSEGLLKASGNLSL